MKYLMLTAALMLAVGAGGQALGATASPMGETGQAQGITGEAERGDQTPRLLPGGGSRSPEVGSGAQSETAPPEEVREWNPEGTEERAGGHGSPVTGLKDEPLTEAEGVQGEVLEREAASEPTAPFAAIDADSSGSLSMEEVQRAFQQADKDGSGKVDFGEYRDAMPNIGVDAGGQGEAQQEMASPEGQSGSGERSAREDPQVSAGQAEQGAEQFEPGQPVKLSEVDQPGRDASATDAPFAAVDMDRDGLLSKEEVQRAFQQSDKDGDSQISAQEWRQAMPRFGAGEAEVGASDMGDIESGAALEGPETSPESGGQAGEGSGMGFHETGAAETGGAAGQQGAPEGAFPDKDEPGAGDPAYFTKEREEDITRGLEEVPTVDPLAGDVPGTGGALEREAEMEEVPGANEPVPTGERGETIVDEQPGNERLLEPDAARDEDAEAVIQDRAAGETESSEEARRLIENPGQAQPGGEAERGATEGVEDAPATEQWTGSPAPDKARQGEVRDWQDYEEMQERAIVEPESSQGQQGQ